MMTTVNGKLIGATNPQRVEMVATLVDAAGRPAVGYVASVPGELVKPVTIVAASDGAWTVDLTPNSQITADSGDTLWAIQEGRAKDGTPQITYVVVPASGGPFWAGNIRATLPGTPTGTSSVVYLPGPPGTAGASAYQTWLAAGHTGTEADFLASLVGPPGQDGSAGTQTPLGAAGAGDGIALRSTDPTTTNPRTPTAHAASHATAGSDPLTPAAIGAEPAGTAAAAVSAHTAATDPHGDRAAATSALSAHTAATDPHGDRAAAASALSGHVAASDPHGNRAYTDTQTALRVPTSRQITAGTGLTGGGTLAADRTLAVAYGTTAGTAAQGNDARLTDARTPTAHAASHAQSGSDPLTLAQAQIAGLPAALGDLLPKAGGTITGALTVEGYTTLAGGQANNGWSAFGALSALAEDASTVHRLDASTGVAALGAKNGLANIRFCGLRGTTGSPATGTWAVGDTVLDSAGALWLCTTAGTPGTWASAAGGGGGGSTIRTIDVRLTPGNVALASSGSWTVVTLSGTQLAASVKAAVGDRIQASPSFMRTGSGCFLDLTILDSAGAISRYFGTDSSTPLSEGHPSYYPQASSFPGVPGTMQIVVGSGEVDGTGKATIALAYKGSGGETIYADSTYPWYMLLTNLGPEPA